MSFAQLKRLSRSHLPYSASFQIDLFSRLTLLADSSPRIQNYKGDAKNSAEFGFKIVSLCEGIIFLRSNFFLSLLFLVFASFFLGGGGEECY